MDTDKEVQAPVKEVQPLDMVAWVGAKNYPTPEAFCQEALQLGVSKRFGGGLPAGIVAGKTRVFLAHELKPGAKEGEEADPDIAGYIFAQFTVAGIMTVGPVNLNVGSAELPIQKAEISQIGDFPERGCGYLVPGGTYLVSEPDMRAFVSREDKIDVLGNIEVYEEPIALSQEFGKYRGYRYIDGDKLLEGEPEEEWMDVDKIKKSNSRVRKGEPAGPKNTVKQAVMDILKEKGGNMPLADLVAEVRVRVPSESARAKVMVRTAIGKMDRDGTIKLERIETVSLPPEGAAAKKD
jgi:hypothetical protein